MSDYLKKAYLASAKKDKGNHDGESDLFSNGDLVFSISMQNYNKAHKLKFKATNKQQKMLRLWIVSLILSLRKLIFSE
jgi:hypothetical protein